MEDYEQNFADSIRQSFPGGGQAPEFLREDAENFLKWFQSNGKDGKEPFAELKSLYDVWRRGFAAPESQRIELGKQFWQMNVDQAFLIGVMGMGLVDYGLHLSKTTLVNVPDRYVNAQVIKTPSNALPMTFYYR